AARTARTTSSRSKRRSGSRGRSSRPHCRLSSRRGCSRRSATSPGHPGRFFGVRPLIGITSYAEEASWGAWTAEAALVPLAYVRSVERAGGRPLVVPPLADAFDETLDALDGLVFTGGGDLVPSAYGAEAHPQTKGDAVRDSAEFALLEGALARELPVLAICRGMQVMNVGR